MSMKITIFAPFDDCLEDEKPSFLTDREDSCDGKLEDTNFE